MLGEGEEPLINRKAAAALLQSRGLPASVAMLRKHDRRGSGPEHVKFSRRCFYRASAVIAWAEERMERRAA